jgi:hypothetical protein
MSLKTIITGLFYIPKLSVQALALLVVAEYRHGRAKAAFRKTLITSGVHPDAARELAKAYPNPAKEILSLSNTRRARRRET